MVSMKILVTGGAGFIGSAFVRYFLAADPVGPDREPRQADLCGQPRESPGSIADDPRYRFVQGDICDASLVESLLAEEKPDAIVHFAAESHVDRSILSPEPVIQTNLRGTFTLLEAARRAGTGRFVHVSTDEVYGSLAEPLEATEEFALEPEQPVFSDESRVGPAGTLVFRDLQAAGRDHAGIQQLRPVPVSGEADPADDRQRARRPAPAGLR